MSVTSTFICIFQFSAFKRTSYFFMYKCFFIETRLKKWNSNTNFEIFFSLGSSPIFNIGEETKEGRRPDWWMENEVWRYPSWNG